MITEETLFILGAGDSKPYGYPTGKELRFFICRDFYSLFTEYIYFSQNKYHFPEVTINSYRDKIKDLADTFFYSSTDSIDFFLARNPDFEEIGKLGIICCILNAEKNSKFREHIEKENCDWYTYLFKRLTDRLTSKDSYTKFKENKVSFITFNYDRSLEFFLYNSFVHAFQQSKINHKIMSKKIDYREYIPFPILHFYGKIAPLPWEDKSGYRYKYDKKIDPKELLENIRVIYDRTQEQEIIDIHDLIKKARRIFFLGFGYAHENMEILGGSKLIGKKIHVYGTAYNYTEREISDIQNMFKTGYESKNPLPTIKNMDNLALLREFL